MANKKNKLSAGQVLNELKNPALIVVGMIGGNMAGKVMDNVLNVDTTQQEGFNAKALAKPVVQLSAGVAGSILLKDDNLKLIASGVAASGVASGVKVLLKKDLLSGFNGLGNSHALNHVKGLLNVQAYDPDLPDLPNVQYETMKVESPDPKNTYEEYREFQEVEIL